MATITGQRRGDNVASSQRVIDLRERIALLEPSEAPISTILQRLEGARLAAEDTKFSWHNDEHDSRFAAVEGAQTSTDATIEVEAGNGARFADNFLVRNVRTAEVFHVSSVATDALTVIRGVGGTTAAAMNDADELYIIGHAGDEGSASRSARSSNPVKVDNYTQIFKDSFEASGSWLSSSNMNTPHDWPYQKKKGFIDHRKSIELAFLLGVPSADVGNSAAGDRRSTGGLLYHLTQNNLAAGGTLTTTVFEQWLRLLFRYGSSKRTVFASALLVSVLNGFSQGKLQTFVGDESFGVKVMEWISPHGTVSLVKHRLLEGGTYSGYGIGVDFANGEVKYRPLDGNGPGGSRDTKWYVNRQAPDVDGQKDEVITECGLQIAQPKWHGVLTGVTG